MDEPAFDPDDVAPIDLKAEVAAAAERHGVPVDLALGVAHQESRFDPSARSKAGAVGVMQLMPGTARDLKVNRYDALQNIDGGVRYLKQQLDAFGDPRMAVAAYNAGPGAVRQHKGVPPYAETQDYVRKILGEAPSFDPDDFEIVDPGTAPPVKAAPSAATAEGAFDPNDFRVINDGSGPVAMADERSLGERFADAFRQGQGETLLGAGIAAGAGQATDVYGGNPMIEGLRQQKETRELRQQADPWYKQGLMSPVAGAVTLGGALAGGMSSPEGFVGPGKSVLGRIGWNAAVNAGTDVPVQLLQQQAGLRQGYDPVQTGLAAGLGAITQGGFEGAGALAPQLKALGGKLAERLRAAREAKAPKFEALPQPKPEEAGVPSQKFTFGGDDPDIASTPITKAQEITRENMTASGDLDPAAPAGSRGNPKYQTPYGNLPEAGQWYVDHEGHIQQAPEAALVAPEPQAATTPAAAPDEAPVAVPETAPETALVDVPDPAAAAKPEAEPVASPEKKAETTEPTTAPAETPDAEFDRLSGRAEGEPALAPREPDAAPAPHEIDRALEHVLSERHSTGGQGRSLVDALITAGGLRDLDEHIPDLRKTYAGRGGRLINRGRGMGVDDAAQWAQERGYIGKPVSEAVGNRAEIADLVEAIGRDLAAHKAGDPTKRVFAADRARDAAIPNEILTVARDLEAEVARLGIDTEGMSAPELRQRLREEWDLEDLSRGDAEGAETPIRARTPEELEAIGHGADDVPMFVRKTAGRRDPDQGELPGVKPRDVTAEAIAQETARRERLRSALREADAGPLFDETARAQGELFAQRSNVQKMQIAPEAASDGAPRLQQVYGGRGVTSSTGLFAAPRPSGKARAAAKVAEPPKGAKRIEELAERFRKALKLTHRQNRMKTKGRDVAGVYNPADDVIRTRNWHQLDALAHEGFHSLDYRNYPAVKAVRAQFEPALVKLAYPGADPAHLLEEGFAEWGRLYVTNPDFTAKRTPKLTAAFEAALANDDPKAAKALAAIRAEYRALLSAPSADLIAGTVTKLAETGGEAFNQRLKKDGLASTVQDLVHGAYASFVDDVHPIGRAVSALRETYRANIGKGIDLKAIDDAYKIARLAKDSHGRGKMMIEHGVIGYDDVDSAGPSLTQALATALGGKYLGWSEPELEAFGSYLIARRMVDEWDRFDAGKIPNEPHTFEQSVWAAALTDMDAAHPTWRKASDMASDWNQGLWKLRYDAGLIGKKTYEQGLAEHPFYVPANRDVADKGARLAGAAVSDAVGDGADAGGTYRFKGSSRDFVNPLQVMMRESYELSALIAANDARMALVKLARKAGRGSGAVVEEIPNSDLKAYTVSAEEAADAIAALAGDGLDGRDVQAAMVAADMDVDLANAKLSFFRRDPTDPRGEPIIFAWEKGDRVALRLADGAFGKDLYTAFVGMPKASHSAALDLLAGGARALRYGVTAQPAFIIANLIRDQLATWITTDVGFKVGITSGRGIGDELSLNKIGREHAAFGGIMGGAQTSTHGRSAARRGLSISDAAPGKGVTRFVTVKRVGGKTVLPVVQLSYLTEISETGTRLGVYRLARDKALKAGMSPKEAAMEAAFQARDYMDFGRHGRVGWPARIIPFLNAQVQGIDKFARVASAGGDLRKVLAPLMSDQAVTPAEQKALNHARKAWLKVGSLGLAGFGLWAAYHDDPDYQDANEQLRATHWLVKADDIPLLAEATGFDGKWVAIPKPFELATVSNIVERGLEAHYDQDKTALEKLGRGLGQLWLPPTDSPLLQAMMEQARNRDFAGRPIVPDYLRGAVDPELQTNSYTGQAFRGAARLTGDATQWLSRQGGADGFAGLEPGERRSFSPAMAEHSFLSVTGSLGRDAIKVSDQMLLGKTAPARGPDDMILSSRFIKDLSRGGQSARDFWAQVGKDNGKLATASGSFNALWERDPKRAIAYLKTQPEARRDFALAEKFAGQLWPKKGHEAQFAQWGISQARMLHPMVRARAIQTVLGDLRQEIRDDKVATADARGKLALTKDQRRRADDVLTRLGAAEMRDALILTGIRGYQAKQTVDAAGIEADLGAVDPELPKVLHAMYARHAPQTGGAIPPQASVAAAWPRLQMQLRGLAAEQITAAMLRKAVRTKAGKYAERRRRAVAEDE